MITDDEIFLGMLVYAEFGVRINANFRRSVAAHAKNHLSNHKLYYYTILYRLLQPFLRLSHNKNFLRG